MNRSLELGLLAARRSLSDRSRLLLRVLSVANRVRRTLDDWLPQVPGCTCYNICVARRYNELRCWKIQAAFWPKLFAF
jgi:hypothetical protein